MLKRTQTDTRVVAQPIEEELSAKKSRTDEKLITVNELSGNSHELGWFPPDVKVGELKRRTSEEMCVPVEALQFATESATEHFDDDKRSLGAVWDSFGPGGEVAVAVRLPVDILEILSSSDDVRTHEKAYEKLVELACAFDGKRSTSMNLNFLRRVVAMIHDGLRNIRNNVCRGWAIEALAKLSQHAMKQLGSFREADCPEELKIIMRTIAGIFGDLLKSELWLERQEACEQLGRLSAVAYHCTELVAFQIGLLCKYCCFDKASVNEKALAYKALALLVQSAPRDHEAVQDSLHSVGDVVSQELELVCHAVKPFVKTLQSLLQTPSHGFARMRGV